jgi:outer membrane protein OmpA-like peptidoglycan-associated protein
MRQDVRLGIVAVAVSILSAGCIATQEWTQEVIGKQQVEVDQHFVKVETGIREQGERLDRVEIRVAQLDTGLTETRDVLRTALPRAASALPPRTVPPPAPAVPAGRRTLIGVVHVPFAFDRADLDTTAEAALGAIVKELRDNPQMTLDLEGTTDPVGGLDYNLRLSQRRVETVRRWLVDKGIDRTRIVSSSGRGPLVDASVKNTSKRRVVVKLMRSGD